MFFLILGALYTLSHDDWKFLACGFLQREGVSPNVSVRCGYIATSPASVSVPKCLWEGKHLPIANVLVTFKDMYFVFNLVPEMHWGQSHWFQSWKKSCLCRIFQKAYVSLQHGALLRGCKHKFHVTSACWLDFWTDASWYFDSAEISYVTLIVI